MFTEAQLNARSIRIANHSKSLQDMVHNHCVDIAVFIAHCGNVTPATTLVNALGDGVRKNAIRQWFLDFGLCSWNQESKKFGFKNKGIQATDPKFTVFDSVAASANPWYTWKPEPEFQPVDSLKLLEKVLKRMKKALDDTEHQSEHKINKAHITALEYLLEGKHLVLETVPTVANPKPEDVILPANVIEAKASKVVKSLAH